MKPSSNLVQPTIPPAHAHKKRAIFWLIAPAGTAIAAFILWIIVSAFLGYSTVRTLLNLVIFLMLGFGVIAFIPGTIYGIILLTKK